MIRLFLSLLCLCSVLFFASGGQVFAQGEALKIAVIDTNKIIKSSKAGKSIQEQVGKKRKAVLKILEKKEKALRAEEKRLIDSKGTVSKEEFLAQRKAFEAKFLETNKFAKKRNRDLEEAYAIAMSTLQKDVFGIVEKISDKEEYTLILRRHDVFLAAKSVDITSKVLKALDAKTKKIPLKMKE